MTPHEGSWRTISACDCPLPRSLYISNPKQYSQKLGRHFKAEEKRQKLTQNEFSFDRATAGPTGQRSPSDMAD